MGSVTQPSFTAGEIKPSLHQRVDISKYGIGCKVLKNFIIHSGGGISNRAGMRYIVKAKYAFEDKPSILVPFKFSVEQNYFLEFGDEYMRVYKDGGLVLNANHNITDITQADPAILTVTAHGYSVDDWVFVSGVNGMYEVNGRFYKVATVPTVDTITLTDLFGNDLNTSLFNTYSSGGTIASVYEIATPYAADDIINAYQVPGVSQEKTGMVFTQSADVMTISMEGYEPYELTRTDHDAWTLTAITFAPSLLPPTGLGTSGPAATGGSTTIKYIVTSVAENGEESISSTPISDTDCKLPGSWVASDYIDISWTAATDAVSYNVYKNTNGFYGFIGNATGVTFRDDSILPEVDDAPPEARDPFDTTGNYPGAVTLHNQRRVFARTNNKPDTVFASQTSNYKNMNVSVPLKDTDALTFTIASEQVNDIKYLMSINDLIGFTGNAEWKLTVNAPNELGATKQSGRGIGPVPPLLIGNTALFVQSRGKRIRDFKFTFESDGYDGNDVSILSAHLFRKTRNVDKRVRAWAYQQEPDSVVWVVHLDGSLSSLTYQREHEVWGWARHETDGFVRWVTCIPEGDKDVIYFLVDRVVDGVTHTMIERLENREVDEDDLDYSFYVDSGLQFEENLRTTLYGLEHLEGKTVSILADGNVLTQVEITDGRITLDQSYATIAIGLPYESDVQPLGVETSIGNAGATQGKMRRIPRCYVNVYNSRQLLAGPDSNHLTPLEGERTDEVLDSPTRLQSKTFLIDIFADWSQDASVFLRHNEPLPCTILSITADLEFGV